MSQQQRMTTTHTPLKLLRDRIWEPDFDAEVPVTAPHICVGCCSQIPQHLEGCWIAAVESGVEGLEAAHAALIQRVAELQSLIAEKDANYRAMSESEFSLRQEVAPLRQRVAELEEQLESQVGETKHYADLAKEWEIAANQDSGQAERIATLERLLRRATEQIIWMSGSDDFGPTGKAAEGWAKSRHIIDDCLATLGKVAQ